MGAIWQVAVWSVLGTVGNETVLLDFYADWCGPCRAMAPVIEQLARRGCPIRKINIDHHPEVAARFGVRAVPCFVMLVHGREVGRELGQVSLARLEQLWQRAQQNLLGQYHLDSGGGTRNPPDGRLFGASSGSSNLPGGSKLTSPVGVSTTKQGLPIPRVEFGVPRSPSGQTASPNGSGETPGAHGGVAGIGVAAGLQEGQPDAAADRIGASGPGTLAATARVTAPAIAPEQDLLAVTVRLRVYHGDSLSHGTGTIIDARQGEALILTCGHLFRENQGRGRIEVDLFGPTPAKNLPGRLIAWNDERDLGLLSIRPPGPVLAARVAPVGYPLQKGLLVFSVGCDHGQEPTVRKTWIVSVNRYLGAPNLQVADQPVSGRSGGGLFSQEGYLIGVCNAADPADREGLFSALPAIHAQLDEAGLQFVYQHCPQTPVKNPSVLAQNLPSSGPTLPSRWPVATNPAFGPGGPSGNEWAVLPGAAAQSSRQDSASGNRLQPMADGQNALGEVEKVSEEIGPVPKAAESGFASEASVSGPPRRGPLMELAAIVWGGSERAHLAAVPSEAPTPRHWPNRQFASPGPPGPSGTTPAGTTPENLASASWGGLTAGGVRPDQTADPNAVHPNGADTGFVGGIRGAPPVGGNSPRGEQSAGGGGLGPEEAALLAELARRHRQGAEIIFIVRPRDDPQANSEVFVLQKASPEMLARLGAAGQRIPIRETSLVLEAERKPEGALPTLVPSSRP